MRYLYILLGLITFGIGTDHLWLNFAFRRHIYLLTAFFWGRSSERLHAWLTQNKHYQKYVHEGIYHRGLTRRARIVIYLVTAAMMSIPFFTSGKTWLQFTLIGASLSQIKLDGKFLRGWWMNNWFLPKDDAE